MSYKARTLFRLIGEINHSLYLPHIQRPFVWEEEQMVKLFDSLMRNYPIQTLLFWRTKDEIKARKFMDAVSWDTDLSVLYDENISQPGIEKVFVLDGQQRLQSLYAMFNGAVTGDNGSRTEAWFDITSGTAPDDEGILHPLRFAAQSPGLPWYRVADLMGKDNQRNAEELADQLNEALDAIDSSFPAHQQPSKEDAKAREKQVRRNLSQLVSLLREEKHFWVQELDGVANEFPYERILDIFVRVNSGGTKLDSSDLMFAAMKEGWDEIEVVIEQTADLLRETKLHFDKTFPLKCLLVVHGRGAETGPEKFAGESGKQLLKDMSEGWDRAEQAFRELRDFLQNDLRVASDKLIRSYGSFIPLFDYLYHNPKPNEVSRARMRAYHYKAQLFGWYSRGTDSVINALHGIVGKTCSTGFPVDEMKQYFQRRGVRTELNRADLVENRLRFILLNLIYVNEMGASPFDVAFKGNEPHIDHIYPRHALSTKLGLPSRDINHLGNYRFVGRTDNIRKRAELPASYFGRLKSAGIEVSRHLLLQDFSNDPSLLGFDEPTYKKFRDERFERIWEQAQRAVNPELATSAVP